MSYPYIPFYPRCIRSMRPFLTRLSVTQGKVPRMRKVLLFLLFPLGLVACDQSPERSVGAAHPPKASQIVLTGRWYDAAQVARGGKIFQQYCASCHKPDASGTPNWRQVGADGRYPPPPLNGSAHAWHHPMQVLRRTVRIGGVPLGGSMPAFGDKLSASQIDDVLAWVQSHWPERVYRIWEQRNAQSGKPKTPMNEG